MKVLLRSFFLLLLPPLRTDMVECGYCIVERVTKFYEMVDKLLEWM